MLVNVLWHRKEFYKVRCGNCGKVYRTSLDALWILDSVLEGRDFEVPVCDSCIPLVDAALKISRNFTATVYIPLSGEKFRVGLVLPVAP